MKYGANITTPIDELKSLALLYVRNQDLSGRTPEDLLDMYNEALNRLWEHLIEQKNS